MAILWENGSTKYQKIIAAPIGIMSFGTLIPAMQHNFVSGQIISDYSVSTSIFLTAIFIALVAIWGAKGLWKPTPAWHKMSGLIKAVTILLSPLILFGMLWANINISLPYLFTLALGTEGIKQETIKKEHSNSRRSCDYRLKITSVSSPLFYYCISESHYNQLPDAELTAELSTQESALGFIVHSIKPSSQRR